MGTARPFDVCGESAIGRVGPGEFVAPLGEEAIRVLSTFGRIQGRTLENGLVVGCFVDNGDLVSILEVLPDSGQVDYHVDSERFEFGAWSDP